jgi:glycosyltransferase involved in cell wall biosynthesis
VLKKIGCSESYTEPLALYHRARAKGMDWVTITDHNTLAGSLEIAHLEHTFVSEEITAYFPEDRCKIHVLAYSVTERQHEDITRLRDNVFELVPYLRNQDIVHALAHPLYSVNDRLTPDHFEQLLLLFNNFEINGSRDIFQNRILTDILTCLTQADLDRIADRYDLPPGGPAYWKKNLTAGSDDHSFLYVASSYTETTGADSPEAFLAGIGQGKARARGTASNPRVLSHNIYSIAYRFYKNKFGLNRYLNEDLLLTFIDHALAPSNGKQAGFVKRLKGFIYSRRPGSSDRSAGKSMQTLIKKEARDIIAADPRMSRIIAGTGHEPLEMEDVWFRFVNRVSEKVARRFADSILESLSDANLFDIFNTIGSAGALYTLVAPYFVAYNVFTKDRQVCRVCRDRWIPDKGSVPESGIRMGHFTDTFYEINGVARNLQMQVEVSRRTGKDLTVLTCGPNPSVTFGVVNFRPIGTFELPEYPELKLYYPPLLRMLDYCYTQDFTHIHSATPGPIGLAALLISRILKLPIYGTYHTAFPQYVDKLTEDKGMEDVMWWYVIWYYKQMDAVYVPSRATGEELAAKGLPKEKIRFYPRGIDIDRFHPRHRNGFFRTRFQMSDHEVKLLYVGRVSKEKNLDVLAEVFRRLSATEQKVSLVVIGDGPYLPKMREELEGLPAVFTGYLEGDDLLQAYASCDIFVFPSTTDTFGNVILEAQASGLPVIVTDAGGPRENLVPGKTGLVVPAGDVPAFTKALGRLTGNPDMLREMKEAARGYMEDRGFESAYEKLWESYRTNAC